MKRRNRRDRRLRLRRRHRRHRHHGARPSCSTTASCPSSARCPPTRTARCSTSTATPWPRPSARRCTPRSSCCAPARPASSSASTIRARSFRYTDLNGLKRLREEKKIVDGMLPKAKAIEDAIRGGVRRVHVMSYKSPEGILAEVFTNEGAGTLIVADMNALSPAEQQSGQVRDAHEPALGQRRRARPARARLHGGRRLRARRAARGIRRARLDRARRDAACRRNCSPTRTSQRFATGCTRSAPSTRRANGASSWPTKTARRRSRSASPRASAPPADACTSAARATTRC